MGLGDLRGVSRLMPAVVVPCFSKSRNNAVVEDACDLSTSLCPLVNFGGGVAGPTLVGANLLSPTDTALACLLGLGVDAELGCRLFAVQNSGLDRGSVFEIACPALFASDPAYEAARTAFPTANLFPSDAAFSRKGRDGFGPGMGAWRVFFELFRGTGVGLGALAKAVSAPTRAASLEERGGEARPGRWRVLVMSHATC